jgi:hypothetical protein
MGRHAGKRLIVRYANNQAIGDSNQKTRKEVDDEDTAPDLQPARAGVGELQALAKDHRPFAEA